MLISQIKYHKNFSLFFPFFFFYYCTKAGKRKKTCTIFFFLFSSLFAASVYRTVLVYKNNYGNIFAIVGYSKNIYSKNIIL